MASAAPEFVALDRRRPFSRADARAAGIALRELLGPRYHKVLYDRYVSSSVPITVALRGEAALAISPAGSYLSHHTAAELWGGIVPRSSDVHITVPEASSVRSRCQGIKGHVAAGRPDPVWLRRLPVSGPAQTFLDLAGAGLDLIDLVVLGDSLVKRCRLLPRDLVEAAAAFRGNGAQRARKAARYVREGVDSPMESRLRMLLVLAGLPEPRVNLIVRAADGSWVRRFDLWYEGQKLLVEYDGRQHAEDADQWQHDIERREDLDRRGLRVIVVTRRQFFDHPERVLERVRDALVERGAVGVPGQFRTEWRRYFPGSV